MRDLHSVIAENLTYLRKANKLTQSQLAERLGYSDKAVSRWENGDSLPDINVLYALCDFYGITLDMLVTGEGVCDRKTLKTHNSIRYGIALGCLAVMFVLLISTVVFIYCKMRMHMIYWQSFIWAIPCSCLAILYINRRYRNMVIRLVVSSLFIWSALASVYLQYIQYNFWLVFIVGIPLQAISIMLFVVKKYK